MADRFPVAVDVKAEEPCPACHSQGVVPIFDPHLPHPDEVKCQLCYGLRVVPPETARRWLRSRS
jgi:hypothetical protein